MASLFNIDYQFGKILKTVTNNDQLTNTLFGHFFVKKSITIIQNI